MKNKALIIILIILISIIICSLISFLVTGLKGGNNFRSGFIKIGTRKSNNIVYDNKFELADIKNIEIKQDAGDIILKETTNDYIQVILYGEDENDVKVDFDKEKLSIDYTHKTNFNFFNFGTIKNDIIIYIPSNYSNNIKIENDYGNCEITDLKNATINIDCDAGNVELGKIKNATIKCDCGNIEIKEILNKCDIKADCGNIQIDTISLEENSTIKADLGNVDIKNTNDIYIDADVDLGKTNINKNNKNAEVTLKIDCDCGNVTVNN